MSRLASATATVDAGGMAVVTLGPVPPGRLWSVDTVTVALSDGTGVARLYEGPTAADAFLIEGTYSGEQDTSGRLSELEEGESITVVWSSATPGETATVLLRGRETSTR